MEMKWNPIVNGDLRGVPKDKRLLFTGIDQDGLYVDFGYTDSLRNLLRDYSRITQQSTQD